MASKYPGFKLNSRAWGLLATVLLAGWLASCVGGTREVQKGQKRLDLARDLLARGQDSAAETELRKAVALDPENAETHLTLGLVHLVRANQNVRLVEIDDCLKGAVAEGLRAEASDQMRAAGTAFETATTLAPDYGEAWQNRGAVAAYFEDWPKAVEFYKLALGNLARLTSEELSLANLGWAYYKLKDYPHASAALLQATQRDAAFCLGTYRLAEVLYASQSHEDALARLEPLVSDARLCPVQAAHYLVGQLRMRQHEPETAAQAFDQCVDLAPRSCVARQCRDARAELPVTPRNDPPRNDAPPRAPTDGLDEGTPAGNGANP